MSYYKWETIEKFNAWHESIKSALGLPFDDGITTEYTTPLPQEDGTIIAYSDDEYAENLIKCDYTTPVFEYVTTDETEESE